MHKLSHMHLVTAAEAAELVGVDRSTIARWVAAGRLTAAHKNPGATGARLFDRAEVEALAADRAAS